MDDFTLMYRIRFQAGLNAVILRDFRLEGKDFGRKAALLNRVSDTFRCDQLVLFGERLETSIQQDERQYPNDLGPLINRLA